MEINTEGGGGGGEREREGVLSLFSSVGGGGFV